MSFFVNALKGICASTQERYRASTHNQKASCRITIPSYFFRLAREWTHQQLPAASENVPSWNFSTVDHCIRGCDFLLSDFQAKKFQRGTLHVFRPSYWFLAKNTSVRYVKSENLASAYPCRFHTAARRKYVCFGIFLLSLGHLEFHRGIFAFTNPTCTR